MKIRFVTAVIASLIAVCSFGQTFEQKQLVGPNPLFYTKYNWVDFNADGQCDIMEVGSFTNLKVHIANGASFTTFDILFNNLYVEEDMLAFNDYDRDGDIDILARQDNNLVIINYDAGSGFSLVNTALDFTGSTYGKIFWFDIDNDLDTDIILGRKVFLNNEGTFTWRTELLPEYLSNPVFEDINKDGLPDLIAGDYESYDGTTVNIYLNQGEGHFNLTEPIVLPKSNLKSNSLVILDANGDSDLDIFAIDNFARGWIFSNNSEQTGELTFASTQIATNLSLFEASASDFNLDGLEDIVAVSSETVTLLRNSGSGTTLSFTPESHTTQVYTFNSLDILDINGDNKPDVHVKGYSSENVTQSINFENITPTDGTLPLAPENLTSVAGSSTSLTWDAIQGQLYTVEVKKDGVIYSYSATSPSGKLVLPPGNMLLRAGSLTLHGLPAGEYEWRVQALDAARRSSPFSVSNTFTIMPGPTDLTLQPNTLTNVTLCWTYTGGGNPSFRVYRGTSLETAVEIANVNPGVTCYEDTVPENQQVHYFVVAVNGEQYSARSNTVIHHSTLFASTSFGTINPNIISALCFPADYDMDGDYDLAFIGRVESSENNVLLKNDGAGLFNSFGSILSAEGIASPYTEMIGPRDIDNDGDLDLVLITLNSWRKQVTVFINDNGTFTTGYESPAYPEIAQVVVEDFNNDGRLDLLYSHDIGNSSGNPRRYELFYQTPEGGFEDSHIVFTNAQSSSTEFFKCADINRDGFMDIIWTPANGQKNDILFNVEGTSFSRTPSILPSHFLMGVEDYSGDGNIDVIVLGNEGLNLYFGKDDYTFTEPKVIPVPYFSQSPTFINADIDLNGWPDLILSDGYNSHIILNRGNGSFKSSDIELGKGWGSSIAITDFDKDGDIDLVKLGNDGQHKGFNNLFRNQSADINVVNQPPTIPAGLAATYNSGKSVFSWSPSTDDLTPQALLSYNLQIIDTNGKIWLGSETDNSGTFKRSLTYGNAAHSTQKVINNLPAGIYFVKVQAMDAAYNASSWSAPLQLTIVEGPTALTIERKLLNKVKLTWTESLFAETNTVVQRRTVQSNWEVIAELPAGSNSYTDSELQYNTLFQYRVFESTENQTTATSNIAEWSTTMWVLEETEIPNLWGNMDVGDYTGDGLMDMALNGGMIYNGYVEDITKAVYENTGSGWIKNDIAQSELGHTAKIEFSDLNGDHKLDLYQDGYIYATGYKTEIQYNNGNKTFSPATNFLTEGNYSILSYFDYDMDNDLDLYVSQSGTSIRHLFENTGDGNYNSVETTSCNSCPFIAAVADFNRDGVEDIIRYESNSYKLYLNSAKGFIGTDIFFSGSSSRVYPQDYNSDGLPDIVFLTSSYYNTGKIYKNLGIQADGLLKFEALPINLGRGESSLLAADFNHDGHIDLAVISPNINILLGTGNDSFESYIEPGYNWGQNTAKIIDFDNDGDLDIYLSGYHNKDYEATPRKAKILLNQTIFGNNGVQNTPPQAPQNLTNNQDSTGMKLSWDLPGDDYTRSGGITYDVVVYKEGKPIVKGSLDPLTGKRIRLTQGRSTGIATLNNLPVGPYTWKVQAVDESLLASDFSAEGSFIFLPPPPVIRDTLIYKCGRTISLTAGGNDIKWYRDEALTQLIASGVFHPEETQIVYAAQTIEGYLGIPKRVNITIKDKSPAPIFSQPNPYTLCESSNLSSLWAVGENIRWYSNAALTSVLSSTATVQIPSSNATYYVTQMIDGCESNPLAVQVKMIDIDSRLYYSDGNIKVRETEGDSFYWYRNGLYYRYTTEPFIPYDGDPASYVVTIRKEQCQEVSGAFILTPIEEEIESIFTVFPNPSSSNVTVRTKRKATIRIYSTIGKMVYSTALNGETEKTVDTGLWAKGVYLVEVDDGIVSYTKRLVLY